MKRPGRVLWVLGGVFGISVLSLVALAAAYVSIFFPPLPVLIGVGGAFAMLAFVRPYVALLITLFTIPFERLTILVPADCWGCGGLINHITLVKLMFGAIIVTALLRMAVSKDESLLQRAWVTPIPALFVLFYGMCWMSLPSAKKINIFAVDMLSMGSGVVAFFIIIVLLTSKERLYGFLKVTFLAYIFVALFGLFEAVTRLHVLKLVGQPMMEKPWTQNPDAFRVSGPTGDPDYYAISVIFGLMVTLAVLPVFSSKRARLGVLGASMLHFLAVVATASRGAALSVALAFGLFFFFARLRRKAVIFIVASTVLAAGFIVFSLAVSSRAATRYAGDTSSWEERWAWIRMSYEMMLDAPVRGIGTGQFTAQYHRYVKTLPAPREPENVANTYAKLAAENGIPATLVYLAAHLSVWVLLYVAMRQTRDPVFRHVATCFLALAISFFFFSLTLDMSRTELSWTIPALGVALWKMHRREELRRDALGIGNESGDSQGALTLASESARGV